jgi:hypothetical protein
MRNRKASASADEVLFSDQLDAVGQALQPAEFSAASRRAKPVLDAARHLALQPDKDECPDRDDIEDQNGMQQRDGQVCAGRQKPGSLQAIEPQ